MKFNLKIYLLACLITATSTYVVSGNNNYITDKQIKAYYKNLPFEMKVLKAPKFKSNLVSITDFGAVGDGVTLNTLAFEKAIEAVSAKGGGTVIVPAGIWLTGPIVLKSNINLHTEINSLILFTKDFSQYPIIDANFEGLNTKRCQSPISARNAENIAITGFGIIDGSGDAWRPVKKEKLSDKQFKAFIAGGGVLSPDKKVWYPSAASMKGQSMCVDQNVPVGPSTDD